VFCQPQRDAENWETWKLLEICSGHIIYNYDSITSRKKHKHMAFFMVVATRTVNIGLIGHGTHGILNGIMGYK
jgi:hypothetical protein